MTSENLTKLQLLGSVAGEEDPGASVDVIRSALDSASHAAVGAAPPAPCIELACVDGDAGISVQVCSAQPALDAGQLLGVVVAHHRVIADKAWSFCRRTGATLVTLEVHEGADGACRVRRRRTAAAARAA